MERLYRFVGRELDLGEVPRTLYAIAGDLRPPVVGAMQVTCSDESESECVDAFRNGFAEPMLPSLRLGERSVFRIANLGGRYEDGAVHIADQHYSAAPGAERFKLLVIKVNAHVGAEPAGDGAPFGNMRRYGKPSPACGALYALLQGSALPFAADLARCFASGGIDRVAVLRDARRVDPAVRSLSAAVVQAGLQAGRAARDVLARPPESPTLFVVISAVTFNRSVRDTELVCGVHAIDRRSDPPRIEVRGLGDDPSGWTVSTRSGRIEIAPAGGG